MVDEEEESMNGTRKGSPAPRADRSTPDLGYVAFGPAKRRAMSSGSC